MALTKPRRTHETSGAMDSRSMTGPFFEVPKRPIRSASIASIMKDVGNANVRLGLPTQYSFILERSLEKP